MEDFSSVSSLPPLTEKGLLKRLAQVPKDQLAIAFYVNVIYGGQYEWMNVIAKKCRERGMLTVAIHTPQSYGKSAIPAAEIQAVIEPRELRNIQGIDAFIISDMDAWIRFPQESKTLACVHSFNYDPRDSAHEYSMQFLPVADGFLLPQKFTPGDRQLTEQLWTNFYDPARSLRSTQPFQLIPCGYPRLVTMWDEINKSPEKADAILYAPRNTKRNPEDGGRRLHDHGKNIIEFLLKQFPDRQVIFRPFYYDKDGPEVSEIVEAFRHEPRFEFDSNMAQLPSFKRAAVLISDNSNVVKSFCVVTGRPVFYFRPWRVPSPSDPDNFVKICYSYEEFGKQVGDVLENPEPELARIASLIQRRLAPLDGALDQLVDSLPDFVAGKTRPEWIEIGRDAGPASVAEIISACAAMTNDAPISILGSALMFAHPHSPLLAAYTLHSSKLKSSPSKFSFQVDIYVSKILGRDLNAGTYGEVRNKDIEELYEMATKDPETGELAHELLTKFREDFPEREMSV